LFRLRIKATLLNTPWDTIRSGLGISGGSGDA
jgi:hypothetical protein